MRRRRCCQNVQWHSDSQLDPELQLVNYVAQVYCVAMYLTRELMVVCGILSESILCGGLRFAFAFVLYCVEDLTPTS